MALLPPPWKPSIAHHHFSSFADVTSLIDECMRAETGDGCIGRVDPEEVDQPDCMPISWYAYRRAGLVMEVDRPGHHRQMARSCQTLQCPTADAW